MAPVNVLIFEPYPFDSEGGNQRTLNYILDLIDKNKFNIILLSPFKTDFVDRVRSRGIECIVIEPPKRIQQYGGKALNDRIIGRFFSMTDIIAYNFKLLSVLKEKRIDVIYSNCIRAMLSIGLAAKIAGVPNLWYIKGELNNKILDALGFVLADRVLFFCRKNMNDKYPQLVKYFNNKLGVLKIGIDPETIIQVEKLTKDNLVKELSITSENINLIILGQLYAPKGVHVLLEAISKVIDKFPQVRLYIVGDHVIEEYNDYKLSLDRLIEQNSLHKHVVFTGWRRDALEILSCMDILVHPSFSEGFGRAVLEAMSLRKPVIASSVGGLREIIKDGENGFLVEPGNANQIADRLALLIKDKDSREKMGQNARNTVFSQYLIDDKIKKMEQIFLEMINSKHTNHKKQLHYT